MRINEAYHDLWGNQLHHPPLPPEYTVICVNNAIQGHPECSRLWGKLINKILWQVGLNPTKHEPCLYQGFYQGQYTLFMRQLDDFAIATNEASTASQLIEEINEQLNLPIHILGEITRYNGMDIEQMQHFVKITCHKYIQKMSQSYPWIAQELKTMKNLPLPFQADHKYVSKMIHGATPDLDENQ